MQSSFDLISTRTAGPLEATIMTSPFLSLGSNLTGLL